MPDAGVVGFVANPASGRVIRRLVTNGALITTHDRVNMVKRTVRPQLERFRDDLWVGRSLNRCELRTGRERT